MSILGSDVCDADNSRCESRAAPRDTYVAVERQRPFDSSVEFSTSWYDEFEHEVFLRARRNKPDAITPWVGNLHSLQCSL